ncbi:MAG: hypothetical protein IT369_06605 [Candidatus Latescibacteria bacterium]|nr:hypothetical protein [Candidatus Latescibacterota bacterium]
MRRFWWSCVLLLGLVACGDSPAGPVAGQRPILAFAGTGEAGLGAEGKPPLQTQLYLPQDLSFGPDGRAYILDWNNHRVRVIDDGLMHTLIGTGELGDAESGPALEVKLNHPTHISFDPLGRLVLAAWHNSKVLRYDFSTGYVETICGTGQRAYSGDGGPAVAAAINLPSATAFDSQGRMYIADQENQRVRRVEPDGTISTVVGTGLAGYSGDGGPAVAAQIFAPVGQAAPPTSRITFDEAGNLYLADTFNNCVRRVDSEGIITTVAGQCGEDKGSSGEGVPATQARFYWPCDVAADREGNLYIADTFNNCVRQVDAAGMITTVAGQCGKRGDEGDGGAANQARLYRPYGIEVDGQDNLYIADTHNHRIRVVPR